MDESRSSTAALVFKRVSVIGHYGVRKSGRLSARILIDGRKGLSVPIYRISERLTGRKHPRLTLRPSNQLQMRLPPQPAHSAEPMIQNPVCRGYSAAAAPFQTSARGSSDILCS